MTAWLSGWLRDIVLIILFAAFVDLLIPNNALQRYVKVAISLMILLTILSPIISLLKSDLDIRQTAEQAIGSVQSGLPPLSAVIEAGGQMRLNADYRSARLVEGQMEEMIRARLAQDFTLAAAEVRVRIIPSEQEGHAVIKEINIALSEGSNDLPLESAAEEAFNAGEVRPVNPVSVEVEVSSPEPPDQQLALEADVQVSSERRQIQEQIMRQMQEWWGVSKQVITIGWNEEAHE